MDVSIGGEFSTLNEHSTAWVRVSEQQCGDEDHYRLGINLSGFESWTVPLTSQITLGKLFNLSVPQFTHL